METRHKVDPSVLREIIQLAELSPTKEVCGLVSASGCVYPVRNVSANTQDFVFSKQDYYEALSAIKKAGGSVGCVYHSHLNGDPTPSANDLASMKNVRLAYLIVAGSAYTYTEYP